MQHLQSTHTMHFHYTYNDLPWHDITQNNIKYVGNQLCLQPGKERTRFKLINGISFDRPCGTSCILYREKRMTRIKQRFQLKSEQKRRMLRVFLMLPYLF